MKMTLTFEVEVDNENAGREWRDKVSMFAHEQDGGYIADWYYAYEEDED